jgi:O-antigen ligase
VNQARADLQAVRDGDYSKDIGYRFASWDAAWNLFLQKPVVGHGIGAYAITSTDASQHGDVLKQGHHAHSIYLQTLATTGLIGGGLLLAVLIGAIGRAWKAPSVHPFALGLAGALLAWSLAGLFDDPHQSGQMFGIYVALIALSASNGLPTKPLPGQSASNRYADAHESDDGIASHQHDA